MKNELVDPAFYLFFMKKLQERLSASSVMPIDQAERIQQSIEFVLDNGEEGSLPERFEQGKKKLQDRLAKLQELYQKIQDNYQSFGIESLEESLNEIGNFFTEYDVEYGAAEVDQAFLDYQLAEAVPANFVGIDFYERYLDNLAAEVFFLKNIPENQIYELLEQYQEKLGFDYRKDVNNLFEIIFKQMIGKLLVGKSEINSLMLNRIEAQYALKQIQLETEHPVLAQLFAMNDYYRRIFQQLQVNARRLNEPESAVHFFITATPKKMQLELPPAMPATRFNQLLEAYSAADQREKIHLIATNISAPADFEEYVKVSLENTEFYKKLFKELNKNFLTTLVLFVMSKYGCESYDDIIDITTSNEFLNLLKDYLETLADCDRIELFSTIKEYQLAPYDFS